MNNFYQRLFTGIAYIALMVGPIIAGEFYAGILFLMLTVITLFEFYRLFSHTPYAPQRIPGIIAGSFVFVISFLVFSGMMNRAFISLIIPVILIILILEIFRNRENPSVSVGLMIFGWLYIAVPYSLSAYLAFPDANHPHYTSGILLGLLSLIWMNDTGAYVVGKLFGNHRLFERISPKKSWEGAVGGTFFTIALGYLLNFFAPCLSRIDWIVLSLMVSVFGVFGDLFESMLKRSIGVKDSGNLLPGHGGVLDRMDSLLFIIPVSSAYLMLKAAF